jgi:pimeloyl-ACP methyl ester carboxylesterase
MAVGSSASAPGVAGPGPRVPGPSGATVATWDLGGTGPELLFLHATGFHGRCYGPLAAELAGRFHCWALDFPGHGESDPYPDGQYDWSRFRDDLLSVVDELGLERPYAVGHSLGGAVAVLAEAWRPGLLSAMFLWEPIVVGPTLVPAGARPDLSDLARRRRARFHSRADALANYAGKPPFSRLRADSLLAYVQGGLRSAADGGVALACAPETEARVYEGAFTAGTAECLGEVGVPVHLVCGENEPAMGRTHLHHIASRLRRATVATVPGLGHMGPLECPQLVAETIVAALLDSRGH